MSFLDLGSKKEVINNDELDETMDTPMGKSISYASNAESLSDAVKPKKCRLTNKTEKCKECDREFSSKDHLKRHVQSVHEGVLFKCDLCPKTCTRKDKLYRHVQSVHKGVRFKCDLCPNTFGRRALLSAHIRRVHEGMTLKVQNIF